jgi:hypothetical protein
MPRRQTQTEARLSAPPCAQSPTPAPPANPDGGRGPQTGAGPALTGPAPATRRRGYRPASRSRADGAATARTFVRWLLSHSGSASEPLYQFKLAPSSILSGINQEQGASANWPRALQCMSWRSRFRPTRRRRFAAPAPSIRAHSEQAVPGPCRLTLLTRHHRTRPARRASKLAVSARRRTTRKKNRQKLAKP